MPLPRTSPIPLACLVAVLGASAALATADGPDFYRVRGVAADDMLNLRRGPGTKYETIVGLPAGREVNILSRERHGQTEWCMVSLYEAPQLQGYVACRFLGE